MMPKPTQEAKDRLDFIIRISRLDFCKPIQVAEVLYHSRMGDDLSPLKLETYRDLSLRWRDAVTSRLSRKPLTSLSHYQHEIWNLHSIPPATLKVLDQVNKRTAGAVERYIYMRYRERQRMVRTILAELKTAKPETFHISSFLESFHHSELKAELDRIYKIVVRSLITMIIEVIPAFKVRVVISSPSKSRAYSNEFPALIRLLLGLDADNLTWEQPAHIYRVGVTNAADRGLDMWANFGPAVQVKHLTLNENLANEIIDQVECDHIVIVCRDAEAGVIQTVVRQIGWGRRVRGIVKESDLIEWYERCLRGKFKNRLAPALLERLTLGFKAEFPQTRALAEFLEERGYAAMTPPADWKTETDKALSE